MILMELFFSYLSLCSVIACMSPHRSPVVEWDLLILVWFLVFSLFELAFKVSTLSWQFFYVVF